MKTAGNFEALKVTAMYFTFLETSILFSCWTESAAALGKTFLGGRGGRGRRMSHLKFFKRYRVGDLFRISRGSQGQIFSNLGLAKDRGGGIF